MPTSLAVPYTAAWMILCAVAVFLVAREPGQYAITRRAYWRFLLAPWKLGMFAIALAFFVLAAPYVGDPTWDRWVGFIMATLTFATAPWSVGVIYRVARRQLPWRHAFVAACAWMLSVSWDYDLYNWWRLGFYPTSWAANIVASSLLYACAGLCWNLTHREGDGVTLGFLLPEWPELPTHVGSSRLLGYVLVFAMVVGAMLLPFVIRMFA